MSVALMEVQQTSCLTAKVLLHGRKQHPDQPESGYSYQVAGLEDDIETL